MAYYIDMLIRQEREEEQRKDSERMSKIFREVVGNVEIGDVGSWKEGNVIGMRLEDCELRNTLGDGEMSFGTVDRDIDDG